MTNVRSLDARGADRASRSAASEAATLTTLQKVASALDLTVSVELSPA